jgi:hypothetical protein
MALVLSLLITQSNVRMHVSCKDGVHSMDSIVSEFEVFHPLTDAWPRKVNWMQMPVECHL